MIELRDLRKRQRSQSPHSLPGVARATRILDIQAAAARRFCGSPRAPISGSPEIGITIRARV
jgi:hypothetical protein